MKKNMQKKFLKNNCFTVEYFHKSSFLPIIDNNNYGSFSVGLLNTGTMF